ncbi:amidase [Rathayibacter tritici]|uniref:Amidase n=1 Tax=Rathayibacter tritici TaxID=33888 RepID=A0A169BVJ6_9MICO|nr:amidase family protein [Rathayibacter tritici]AND15921.1 amidase [Rathayibacter tritici]PPI41077.1 amidase [Rathayibacter tritici]
MRTGYCVAGAGACAATCPVVGQERLRSRGDLLDVYDYVAYDAIGLRDLLRAGDVTIREVEQAAREALSSVDETLNALAGPLFEPAAHHDARGDFAGVPFVVKDSGPFVSGSPFHVGSRAVNAAVALDDHALMKLLRRSGFVGLGRSTMPEFGLSFATESPRHGITRNPWDPTLGAGGSSGGAAALVASGAVPFAHANDSGGSIRVPASSCGVIGLKPSRGRTPCGPFVGQAGFGQTSEFVITRTIRDTAHLLDVCAGATDGDKFGLPRPRHPFVDAVTSDPGRLRVAALESAWGGGSLSTEVAEITGTTAALLEWIGHDVTGAPLILDLDEVIEASMLTVFATGLSVLESAPSIDRSLLQAVPRTVLRESAAASAADVARASAAENRVTRQVAEFFEEHDLLLTPTMVNLPPAHGTLDYDDPGHDARSWLRRIYDLAPFTAAFNVSGNPAISLPIGLSREGVPIGIQLVAARGREDLLISVAAQLEHAAPWAARTPRVTPR